MQTVNISLPKILTQKIDKVVVQEGYASRSEFVRALIRFYLLSEKKEEITLMPFRKVSLKTIEKDMRTSGLYNEKFIKSVVSGLARSSAYGKN
jgi:metal-responsive CopG/Arc/MetJ family transcriptional regulator